MVIVRGILAKDQTCFIRELVYVFVLLVVDCIGK